VNGIGAKALYLKALFGTDKVPSAYLSRSLAKNCFRNKGLEFSTNSFESCASVRRFFAMLLAVLTIWKIVRGSGQAMP
jgi:hypothetical protein